jgi:hypothetical protein
MSNRPCNPAKDRNPPSPARAGGDYFRKTGSRISAQIKITENKILKES